MEQSEIICKFLDAELCVDPNVLTEITRRDNAHEIVDKLISSVKGDRSIVTLNDVEALEVVVRKGKKRVAEEYESEIKLNDVSKESPRKGGIEDFFEYFNSRYEKAVDVFKKRKTFPDFQTIKQAMASSAKTDVRIIGLVESIRKSRKGNTVIFVEDPTGIIPVVVLSSDRELSEFSKTVVTDEAVCVEGFTGSGEGGIIIAKNITLPDVPIKRSAPRVCEPLAIAMISDIHVGSYEFMENEFSRFIKWLNCEIGTTRQIGLAEKVKYLVIAGDLVDGVGIYPGQIEDLSIKDIYGQYKRLSQLLDQIPDYIEIIISPGNHDATRQAEPQPPIFEDFAGDLHSNPRVHMVGNPCYANLHGTNVLIYHGRSMDDIISKVSGLSYSKPEQAMLNLMKKRQLVPIFGEKVPVSPGYMDCLFIEEVPDILHSGHVHTTGVLNYRGVTLVNSGAFQSQTDFQKRVNMVPDPGKVPVFDLDTGNTTIMKFT